MPDDEQLWHDEVITGATEGTMRRLQESSVLEPFYLAGGTALALHLGHRLSHDLDFFSPELFDEEILLQRIQREPGFSLVGKAPHTLHANVQETKVSFLGYAYPILFPLFHYSGVAIADPRDIACMKISAIASRGTKRDFVDLFMFAAQRDFTEFVRLFETKYEQARYSRVHVLKSLTFFEDAEKDPMPHMLIPLEWADVKQYFLRVVPQLF